MTGRHWLLWCLQLGWVGLLGWIGAIAFASSTFAQSRIVPDRTLSAESSIVTPNVQGLPREEITGGAIRGANLFHSFREFNVDNGRGAYFQNPNASIKNIFTRVTGGQVSNILGTLGVDGGANLFLLNPNGILFGPNARLDVRGSFLGTTANSFVFPNKVEFSATNPQAPPLLTISVPIGLQFGSQPGRITSRAVSQDSQGNFYGLSVASGSTLALIGGEITLDGGVLFAPNGQVQLGAVGGETTVGLQVNSSSLGFSLPENAMRSPITLTDEAFVRGDSAIKLVGGQIHLKGLSEIFSLNGGSISIDATGLNLDNGSQLITRTINTAKAGDIRIKASNAVTLTNGNIRSESNATGNGGDVSINARNISILGDKTLSESTISTFTNSQGNAGNLTLEATESVNVTNGSFVVVLTNGAGNTGDLTIRARESVNVIDNGNLSVFTSGLGSTGDLRIETGTFNVSSSKMVGAVSSGSGSAGSIFIQARDAVELINGQIYINATDVGKVGNLTIETQRLNLRDGGLLNTNTYGGVNAGNIVIRASDSIKIGGVSPSDPKSFSYISSDTFKGTGNAGNITIETPRLTLSQGGTVSALSEQSKGNAGSVTIHAKNVELDGFVILPKSISRSSISTQVSDGEADVKGGTLTINTERLRLSNGARLTTFVKSGRGQAGNLVVRASDSIDISGVGPKNPAGQPLSSGLFADVQTEGIGSGGSINVETGRLSLSDGGQISASTFAEGNAGNVLINAAQIDLRGKATAILTKSEGVTGNAGDIRINTQGLNLQDGAYLSSAVEEGANGNGGTLNINTDRLTIRDGAGISSRTAGNGRAGYIRIDARDSIILDGIQSGTSSYISSRSTETATEGSGDITLNTNTFRLNQGATIRATTANAFGGGNVTINANTIDLTNGGQILTSTTSSGSAGTIALNADRVNLASVDSTYNQRLAEFGRPTVTNEGEASGLYATTTEDSSGKGGIIRVNAPQLNINDRAGISVNSQGSGIAGNINLNSQSVQLRDRASIIARTASQDGGNISMENTDLLLLRQGSQISTTAAEGGNGGNININSKFIVAVPKENSDITANAFSGTGGRVQINTQGLFGIQSRSQLTDKSDITASSTLGVAGVVNIYTPDPNTLQSNLTQLPENIIDANALIANSCIARRHNQSGGTFIITGSAGLPERPGDPPLSPYPTGTIRSVPSFGETAKSTTSTSDRRAKKNIQPIVEAQGIYRLANGDLVLSRECP